jgi:periplasmic copper chaperone A
MTKTKLAALGAAVLLLVAPVAALAHVTLEAPQAVAGSTYKAVLRVPHGCAGAATLKVRVQMPEGFIGVKPMPKAGWTLDITKGKYEGSYDLHGSAVTEGVKELSWTGNLPDDYYDEFVFRGTLTEAFAAGTTVYFPVVQECEGGKVERWIEVPADGKTADDYESPAPGVKIVAPAK